MTTVTNIKIYWLEFARETTHTSHTYVRYREKMSRAVEKIKTNASGWPSEAKPQVTVIGVL